MVIEHFNYIHNTMENDIVLLKVEYPFRIDGWSVSPVCLPMPDEKFTSKAIGSLSVAGSV